MILQTAQIITSLNKGETLTESLAYELQASILRGELNTEAILRVFKALSARQLAESELVGFFRASSDAMTSVDVGFDALDTCGTGGDNSGSFNISTAAGIICAAAGVPVAKHGNRASTSSCGSADVLEALGVKIEIDRGDAVAILKKCGFVFLYARAFHPAFKHAAEARKSFGQKTYFNLLGPLLNPARSAFRVHGLADFTYAKILGRLLINAGTKKVWLVHAENGMDEISTDGPTQVMQIERNKEPFFFTIEPRDFGLSHDSSALKGGDAKTNARIIAELLQGRGNQAQKAAVILNAAAGLTVFGQAENFAEGIKLATWAVTSGKAHARLQDIIKFSHSN